MARGITGVDGIEVGHWTSRAAATGCTVILCRQGAVAGVDVRGGAPGTQETDSLRPGNLVQRVHAGVMRYLEEGGVGFRIRDAVVPVVPAARAVLRAVGLATGLGGVPSVRELSRE